MTVWRESSIELAADGCEEKRLSMGGSAITGAGYEQTAGLPASNRGDLSRREVRYCLRLLPPMAISMQESQCSAVASDDLFNDEPADA